MASIPAAAATSQNVSVPFIPELTNSNFLDILLPSCEVPEAGPLTADLVSPDPINPLMDALKQTVHRTVTWNNANAYDSTLDPVVDAFYGMRPYIMDSELRRKLEMSWTADPLSTLRIIWNTRSIHDGKGAKEVFYQAWGWLYQKHPRTAIENLHLLVKPACKISKEGDLAPHGYWKDLLNLVCLAAVDQLGPYDQQPAFDFLHAPRVFRGRRYSYGYDSDGSDEESPVRVRRGEKPKITPEEAVARQEKEKVEARERRVQRRADLHETISSKLGSDPHFRALYIAVARMFADQLVKDTLILDKLSDIPAGSQTAEERDLLSRQVSLAGKWAPTPGLSHDRHSNMATAIAMLIHFAQKIQTPSGISITPGSTSPISPLDAHVLRSFYHRWVLRPLRAHIHCPEPLMSANRWTDIRYTRVPSICMQRNMPHFYTHDPEGFEKYLEQVEKGTKRISGATLMPHTILGEAMACYNDINHPSFLSNSKVKPGVLAKITETRTKLAEAKVRTFEAQWKTMLERVKETGQLENSLAVCDVSGSMGSLYGRFNPKDVDPILPAVALSMVLAQTASPPFNNGFISFSEHPEFIRLDPSKSLAEMAREMVGTDWGMNTDFDAVFLKLLLPLATQHAVKPEDMVKRLFVFSDMQFDESRENIEGAGAWETNHDVIERAYNKAGYEMPEIVYWNLAGGEVTTTPVTGEKKGVALMSGFSPNMLKVFVGLDEEEAEDKEWVEVGEDGEVKEKGKKAKQDRPKLTPKEVVMKALGKESFSELIVVD
ncbi:hypothetical protein EIP91_002729 [Steccherinum ochraceum]|uniref:DUF2828 domain-containing protein n=1 Tax=Steccherinum ochraceum TaxID=92696 RepID=A0A4R0RHZ6_9APHY|nr:hypothetical protein EIP91_002729 [Steccherinum ochraceum]